MWDKVDKLSNIASFYLERTKIIQGNIANADTPGYKPKDLVFEDVLQKTIDLKKTDIKHIDPEEKSQKFKEITLENVRGYDNNRVDIQEEMAKLAESSIMYKAMVENLKKEFEKLKIVINGR